MRAVSIVLSYAPDRDWNLEEEMKGWGVGESPLLPSYGVRSAFGAIRYGLISCCG